MSAKSYRGERIAEDVHRAAEPGGPRRKQFARAPGRLDDVLHNEDHAEGSKDLEELRCTGRFRRRMSTSITIPRIPTRSAAMRSPPQKPRGVADSRAVMEYAR